MASGSGGVYPVSPFFVILLFTILLGQGFISATNLTTLQLVQIIARHGDRAPLRPYPNDIYKNASVYSLNGWAELTEFGAKQVLELGLYLRRRYDGFLPRKYRKKDFYMISSDVDRAIMSGESNLAGLYQIGPALQSPDIFKEWQPVPIHTIPAKEDNIINGKATCPRYVNLLSEHLESEEMRKLENENKLFVDFLENMSGMPKGGGIEPTFHIHDALLCQRLHNLTLPKWANSTVYNRLEDLKGLSFAWKIASVEMKRLKVGPLLARLLEEMRTKVESGTLILDNEEEIPEFSENPAAFRKMYIYSGHDSTIAGLLDTLKIFKPHIPPYAAALFIELHKKPNTGEYFIQLYYRNDTSREPYQLDTSAFCGNGTLGDVCPFQTFSSYVRPFIPENWTEECQLLRSSSSGMSLKNVTVHPLSVSGPGLLGFMLAVISVTSLFGSTILLSSFLRKNNMPSEIPLSSYQHLS